MGFEKIVGQEIVLESLAKTIKSGEIGHAYLFSGPPGSGKKTLALLFAQALNCTSEQKKPCQQCLPCRKINSGNHPDVHLLKPQGSSIRIGQLREIKEKLYLLSIEGRKKICIIYNAELMTLPAANSLLKILEDPPGDLVFILLSARPWDLPPTIVSRCVQFALTPLASEKIGHILEKHAPSVPGDAEIIIALAGGNPGKGLEMVAQGGWEKKYREAFLLIKSIETGPAENLFNLAETYSRKEDLQEILDLLILIYRDRLVRKLGSPENASMFSLMQSPGSGGVESYSGTGKIIMKTEKDKNAAFLEKICRALLQLQKELN